MSIMLRENEMLVCPQCRLELRLKESSFQCSSCGKSYSIVGGIPDFRGNEGYWCHISREKMQLLNKLAKERNDWVKAAEEFVPQYMRHFYSFERADAQFFWPSTSTSRILDAGSMWGGLTIPAAQYCGEIFAVDKTMETLVFLKIRAEQMGFRNVRVIASNFKNLPFPDNYFDLVILNGVLEWVAFDQEVVVEEHWGRRRTDCESVKCKDSKNPKQIQIEVLGELHRVLKSKGHLCLAIENSIGYRYIIGVPDTHMNLKYVSFLPRFLANAITKWKLNCEYRTYLYSLPGYRSLLKKGGFQNMEFYGTFPHYALPSEIVPEALIKYRKRQLFPLSNASWFKKIAVPLFPRILLKYICPSFMVIASKDGGRKQARARLVQLLRKAELLSGSLEDAQILKCSGRTGDHYAVNFLIYSQNKMTPVYFCKICRNMKYTDLLKAEANNLRKANELLKDTALNSIIPKLLYFGTIDEITFLVTQFIAGRHSEFNHNAGFSKANLRKLDESIQPAIRLLVKFQKYTKAKEIQAIPHLLSVIEKQKGILNNCNCLTKEIDAFIQGLIGEIKALKELYVPLCAIQGEYEFSNLLFKQDEVAIVDFKHFEKQGFPFFDLANLIFNPIIYSHISLKRNDTILDFVAKNDLEYYIKKWLKLYSNLSGLSEQLLRLIGPLAVLEQNTKTYPFYCEPLIYPMHSEKILKELLSFRIEL